MKTKLSAVQEHMRSGQWQNAIRLAAKFPQLGTQRNAILGAHTAYTNPRFVVQIKQDPEALKAAGQKALLDRFGLE